MRLPVPDQREIDDTNSSVRANIDLTQAVMASTFQNLLARALHHIFGFDDCVGIQGLRLNSAETATALFDGELK